MKLHSLKVSNILTFEKYDNIDDAPEISFENKLNILIGTNASGKSNFLEIINSLFKSILIQGCNFNEGVIDAHSKDPQQNPINRTLGKRGIYHNLNPNHKSGIIEQMLKVKLELEEADFDNMQFLLNNMRRINSLIQKYSKAIPTFAENIPMDYIKRHHMVEFSFSGNSERKSMDLRDDFGNDEVLRFIFHYFHYYEFFQNIILIANRFEGENWEPLNMICALISSYRNYDKIEDVYQIQTAEYTKLQPIYTRVLEESTRKAEEKEPPIFEFTRHKLAYALSKIENLMVNNRLADCANKTSLQILAEKSKMYNDINQLLKDNLKLKLDIRRVENSSDYKFSFVNLTTEEQVDIFEMSSGEKGLIHFIFSLQGYEIKNGVMIIDEPELHLHPQIQNKYLDIIDKVRNQLGIQFIFATHSPVFINSKTIQSVYRFYKDDGFTKIVKPTINEPEKDLIHFLTYTNSSKIFFGDKVVLVEGDKDYYFFKYYLNNYKIRNNIDTIGIEFLIINGKGEFEKWKNFLNKYKITTYYIGDLDNLLLDSVSPNADNWRNIFGDTLRMNQINSIRTISTDYRNLQLEIAENYSRKVMLLSNGSLEDYLSTIIGHDPNFDDVIRFCRNSFQNWISNLTNPFVMEIDFFMKYIVH